MNSSHAIDIWCPLPFPVNPFLHSFPFVLPMFRRDTTFFAYEIFMIALVPCFVSFYRLVPVVALLAGSRSLGLSTIHKISLMFDHCFLPPGDVPFHNYPPSPSTLPVQPLSPAQCFETTDCFTLRQDISAIDLYYLCLETAGRSLNRPRSLCPSS